MKYISFDRQLICVSFDGEVASPLENNCTLSRHDSIHLTWTLDIGKQENVLLTLAMICITKWIDLIRWNKTKQWFISTRRSSVNTSTNNHNQKPQT